MNHDRDFIVSRPRLVDAYSHFPGEDGQHLLVHPTRPRWLVLNRLGYEIALLCDGRKTVAQIAKQIAVTYNQGFFTVLQQAEQYLSQLDKNGWFFTSPACEPEPAHGLEGLFVQITERCNLRCQHCYAWSGSRPPAELSFDRIRSMVDQAAELGGKVLTLSGGEPLLHPRFREILEYAGPRLKVQLLTNGILVDASIAKLLAGLGVRVQVSLDGSTPETHDRIRGTGAFAGSLQGVRLLREAGAAVVICTVNMKGNLEERERMSRLAHNLGVSLLRFIPLRCSGRGESNWEALRPGAGDYAAFYRNHLLAEPGEIPVSCGLSGLALRLPPGQGRWCPIGRNLNINALGEAHACLFLTERKYGVGYIGQLSLSSMLFSDEMNRLRQIRDRRVEVIPRCAACTWKNFCQAGCPGLAYAQTGSLWETDNFCDLRRELYPRLIFNLARKKVSRSHLPELETGEAVCG